MTGLSTADTLLACPPTPALPRSRGRELRLRVLHDIFISQSLHMAEKAKI